RGEIETTFVPRPYFALIKIAQSRGSSRKNGGSNTKYGVDLIRSQTITGAEADYRIPGLAQLDFIEPLVRSDPKRIIMEVEAMAYAPDKALPGSDRSDDPVSTIADNAVFIRRDPKGAIRRFRHRRDPVPQKRLCSAHEPRWRLARHLPEAMKRPDIVRVVLAKNSGYP